MTLSPLARKLLIAAAVLLALVAAFSAGRFTAPERVQTVERWQTLDLTTQDLTRGFTFTRTVEVTRWRNVTTTTTDAGTVTVDRTVEREGSATASAATERDQSAASSAKASEQTRQVTRRPDWRVSVQAGASLVAPKLPITGPLVVGASVERRILGGVSAGLWVNTVGAGGVVVSGEF